MDIYFAKLTKELRELSWPELERVARNEFAVDPNEYETKEDVVQACIAVEQYAAFS